MASASWALPGTADGGMRVYNGPMRILGYCRASTAEQATEGMTLDSQEHRIRAWAEAMDAEVVDVIREEVSGAKLLPDRPGGVRISRLLDARRPEADAVVVVRMDRLGRDAAEQLALLKRFRTGRVGIVAIAQSVDLATPHGRAMAGVGAVFNQLERELIAERTTDALAELRRQGRPWNHPPFGWQVEDGHLVPDPGEQATLDLAAGLRAAAMSFHKIAAELNDRGCATKRGGPWQAMSVRSVLSSAAKMPMEAAV